MTPKLHASSSRSPVAALSTLAAAGLALSLYIASAFAYEGARFVVCHPGFTHVQEAGAHYCKRDMTPADATPTCGKLNLVNDWKWDAGTKSCFRKKVGGARVDATENIECPADYVYDGSKGLCHRPAAAYRLASLIDNPSYETHGAACWSPQECKRVVACPPRFELVYVPKAPGLDAHYYCKNEADTNPPSCKAHNMVDDWKWSSADKKCKRTRANGDVVFSTANIDCPVTFTYDAGAGVCKLAAGTLFREPILK